MTYKRRFCAAGIELISFLLRNWRKATRLQFDVDMLTLYKQPFKVCKETPHRTESMILKRMTI